MKTLIKNTCIVTMNEKRDILYTGAIYIEEDRIVDIGPTDLLEERWSRAEKIVDGTGKIVFPGLVNTHNHLYQVLLKGLGDDMVLKDWLEFMTFPSSPHLTEENCYYAALNGLAEGIHSGVTTTFDYMYPHAKGTHNLDEGVLRAMKDLKIRGVLGRGYMDTGIEFGVHPSMIEKPEDIEASVRRLYKEYQGSENGRISIGMAPAALWSNSDASLKMTQRVSEDLDILVSIHVSETPFDKEATHSIHGKWEMPLLKSLNLLNDQLIMVHCVYLSEEDIDDIKAYGATVSHNPMSNMYLSSGVAPVPALNKKGVPVGLGLDGAASNNSNDMIELLKATALLQKVTHKNPTIITADKVLEMATIEGAKSLKMDHDIGSLEIGKKGDLFIFNPALDLKAIPTHNPVSTLIYSSGNKNVESVMIDGNFVLEDSKLLVYDEAEIASQCQRVADELSINAGTDYLKKRPWKFTVIE